MPVAPRRARWLSARAIKLHCLTLLAVPLCLLAGYWQANRAMAGNTLSYAYAIEWPAFAVLAVWGWWQLLHAPAGPGGETPRAPQQSQPLPPRWDRSSESPALQAYNERLQALHHSGAPRKGRR